MHDEPKALAVIIGRAGSKGLPGKNSLPLGGRPMICHTIEDALQAECVDRVIVSTDGSAIAAAARSMDIEVVARPGALASDSATVDAAVRHAVEQLEADAAGARFEVIVILYANVPARPDDLIDRAVQTLIETGADSVQSYSTVGKHHPYWMVRLDDDGRVAAHVSNTVYRRQDLPPLFLPDGGAIAVRRESLFHVVEGQPHAFLGADRRGIISPPGSVIDIDTAADLAIAEALLNEMEPQMNADEQLVIPAQAGIQRLRPKPLDSRLRGNDEWQQSFIEVMKIGSTQIAAHTAPYVIAEVGVNHDGSLGRALELVHGAARAGADAVKLQLFEADRLLSRAAQLAEYQRGNHAADAHALLHSLQLGLEEMAAIIESAHSLNLHAIVTIFNIELAAPAAALPWDAYKTASPDIVNRPLIETLMEFGKPMLVSSGASTLDEVAQVTRWLGNHPHILMQCVSAYPTPDEYAALTGRIALMQINPCALGYSDHTTSLDTGALAVASGARVLEKHLTHDRGAPGPDHAASLDVEQFAEYVRLAQRAFTMLGEPAKRVLPIEREVRELSRQSLATVRAMAAGHTLQRSDIAIKRPGGGIAPDQIANVIGRRLARAIEADVPLTEDALA